MKCLILAAGYATRLYPLTENFPKPLLKVKDKTKKMFIGNKQLLWGHNQDFYLDTKEELKKAIENLASDCEINNLKLVLLATSDYKGTNVVNINYSLTEDKSQVYKKIMM